MADVTRFLKAVEQGEAEAAERILPVVYDELRKLAAARLSALGPGQTLQPTALVHEAWLRLANSGQDTWNSRGHFFSAAAEAMRRILIDRARERSSRKHGGGLKRVNLEHVDIAADSDDEVVLALDEALGRYAQRDPQGAELIKLRFFAGLPNHEAAELLGMSERSAKRTWAFARAWLLKEIEKNL